jgi:DedD protein
MARAISDEELQLKRRARRRLLGAVVLVTAIIVGLPMVLDSEPKPVSREITVKIPSPDAGTFTAKVLPQPAAIDAKAAKAVESKAAAKPAEEQQSVAATSFPPSPVAVTEAPKVTAKEKPKAAKAEPAKASKASKPAKPAAGQFVVQVIALADAEKAKQMQAKITAAGIRAYTEIVKTAKGDVTRVRAGPFATREAAEKAREQLKSIGMNGNVTTR